MILYTLLFVSGMLIGGLIMASIILVSLIAYGVRRGGECNWDWERKSD